MLFILTGDIQTGKTRWLSRLVEELVQKGVISYGVLAPGLWIRHDGGEDGPPRFEKRGIENILLPEGRRIPFALRRDIAEQEGCNQESSQSAQARLGWEISDAAIGQVNAHFRELGNLAFGKGGRGAPGGTGSGSGSPEGAGLLVVDELGRLELLLGQGLSAASDLLSQGPCGLYRHALVVVRRRLVDDAFWRFHPSWPDIREIGPDAASFVLVQEYVAQPRTEPQARTQSQPQTEPQARTESQPAPTSPRGRRS